MPDLPCVNRAGESISSCRIRLRLNPFCIWIASTWIDIAVVCGQQRCSYLSSCASVEKGFGAVWFPASHSGDGNLKKIIIWPDWGTATPCTYVNLICTIWAQLQTVQFADLDLLNIFWEQRIHAFIELVETPGWSFSACQVAQSASIHLKSFLK